jgi:hypothetical protein
MNTTAQPYVLFALTVLLSACGGGSSSSTSTAETPVVAVDNSGSTGNTTSSSSAALQTTSTSNYVVGSTQQQALSLLNNQRGLCGFGLLNQNTQLDLATKNHATYLLTNNLNDGHFELNSTAVQFTGKNATTRAIVAGYNRTNRDFLAEQLVTIPDALVLPEHPNYMVRSLLSAPYHLVNMVSGARDVGMALLDSTQVTPAIQIATVFNLLLGVQSGAAQQEGAADQILTYPCQGVTDTLTGLFNESPSPVEDSRDLRTDPVGQPIYIQAKLGQTLTVSAFSLKDPSGGAVLAQLTTSATDRHGLLKANQAFILPLAPLAAQTIYQVHVQGLRNSTPYTVDFSFKTGVANRF